MRLKDEIFNLVSKLNYYTKLYDEGKPAISDEEWDDLYFRLVSMEKQTGLQLENSPTNRVVYSVQNELKKVTHNHPMLSLDKTKDLAEVKKIMKPQSAKIVMCKMDGLTCSLKYDNGELVSAETRGNGYVGEDVTHNARVIKSIPKHIDYKKELIVDGEIICRYDDFDLFKEMYKNPRNFASGSIRLLDSKECEKRKLTFVAWEVISGFEEEHDLSKKLEALKKLNFTVVPYMSYPPFSELDNAKETLVKMAKDCFYPIDGLVYKYDDVEYGKSLGSTTHHFKNAIAFKFYDEEYESKLVNIEWTIGRTGVLTPVAVFVPVEIEGTLVGRASLHNCDILKEILGEVPYIGEKIFISKRNMIIPQIERAERNEEDVVSYIKEIEHCPYCGLPLEKEDGALKCKNIKCRGKKVYCINYYCGKQGMDIKNINEVVIDKLIDYGFLNSIEDLYKLNEHKRELINKPNWGTRGTTRLLNSIEDSKNNTLSHFIAAIGIPLIGPKAAKELAKRCIDYNDFRNKIKNKFDFGSIAGFGESRIQALYDYDYEEADRLVPYLNLKNELFSSDENSKILNGKKFVITGSLKEFKNREELNSVIEKLGGTTSSSVSRNTSYLINNDPSSTSGKNEKAKQYGVPIISEQEFMEKFYFNK